MPRLECNTEEEFKMWAVQKLNPEKYDIYYTNEGEIIALPFKSTRPVIYAYVNLMSKERAKNFAKKLNTDLGVLYFSVKKFVWNSEREPLE